jgi:hypothetical protein
MSEQIETAEAMRQITGFAPGVATYTVDGDELVGVFAAGAAWQAAQPRTVSAEQHEALRAGVEALAADGEAWGQGVAVDLSRRLRALLAEAGEVR